MQRGQDRKKKVKMHFKVHTSLQNHQKTAGMWGDDHLLAAYVRLGSLMVERFADRTGNTITLTGRDLCNITANPRADRALETILQLCEVTPVSIVAVKRSGNVRPMPRARPTFAERSPNVDDTLRVSSLDVWRMSLPNFARKQGFLDWEVGTAPAPAPATAIEGTPHKAPPIPSPVGRAEAADTPSPPARRPRGGSGRGKHEFPKNGLPLDDKARLLTWADRKGFTVAQCTHAIEAVYDWARSNGKMKKDWVATIQSGMRAGWALRGFTGGDNDDVVSAMKRRYKEDGQ